MTGFVPPPYPYDRLDEVIAVAAKLDGGAVDLSIGTPIDPPMPEVLDAFARADGVRGYPSSIGSLPLRTAAAGWFARRLGVTVDPETEVAVCVGTKEFVASLPQYLRLRDPSRDTILYPAISYPTYEMGATLGGCRAVPYRDLSDISSADAARALALWVNSPSNPTGRVVGPRRRGFLGTRTRRARRVGRVLRRLHVDGRPDDDSQQRHVRPAGGAFAVEARQLRRRPGRVLRR